MVFYAQSGFCRWKILLEYFDEAVEWDRCGHCDNCLNPPEQALSAQPVHGREPSRSVAAEPEPSPQPSFPVGASVEVPKVGKGQVVSAAGDMVTVVFPNSQTRMFLKSYVRRAEAGPG
jgi:ATP-dependent DNA helicase RecQ